MSAHTPTPWAIWVSPLDRTINISSAAGDEFVCACGVEVPGVEDTARMAADAAFIVKACNAHHPLVEALKELVSRVEDCDNPRDQGLPSHDDSMQAARAVLASLEQDAQ